jgi:hypothetical protein
VASKLATATILGIAVVLGTPRVLQSATSTLLSASFQNSTYAALNDWAMQNGVPHDARILYDDLAYFDPKLFPNAVMFGSALNWEAVDAKAPDYIVISSSIYGAPHYRPLMEKQKLGREDRTDPVTGAKSVRLYQDLLAYERFGPTKLAGVEYVADIKAKELSFTLPEWSVPSWSPTIDWALTRMWWAEFWLRKSLALIPTLMSPGQPIEGFRFHVYRIHVPETGQWPVFATPCTAVTTPCTDFKQKLAQGDEVIVAMDACQSNIGTIYCGRDYTIRYWKEDNTWCSAVSGPNSEDELKVTVLRDCLGNPKENVISIFGAAFWFNGRGEVYYLDSGKPLVGHLK